MRGRTRVLSHPSPVAANDAGAGQGRCLSFSSPFRFPSGVKLRGYLKRPSDGAEPEKIAWIQCVGSRDAARQALEAYKSDRAEVHLF